MISLRRTATEMERQQELLDALKQVYWQTIHANASYAVEFDPGTTEAFREQLLSLHSQYSGDATPQEYEKIDKLVRSELKLYCDRAREQIGQMRRGLEEAASVMALFVQAAATDAAEYEGQLKQEVHRLEDLAQSDNIERIRGGIRAAAEEIVRSFSELQRSNQLTIGQLKDEIRTLHQAMETDRQKQYTDTVSGGWNRLKVSERIGALQDQNQAFCVLVIAVRNWKQLQALHSRAVLQGALQNILRDVTAIVGDDVTIGRWSDGTFAAVLELPPTVAVKLGEAAQSALPPSYAVKCQGATHTVRIQVTTGIADRPRGVLASRFTTQLRDLIEVVAGAEVA